MIEWVMLLESGVVVVIDENIGMMVWWSVGYRLLVKLLVVSSILLVSIIVCGVLMC